jgi:MbtH protein
MFLVLVSPAGRHSIWPAELPVPAGWQVVHGVASRLSCEDFVHAINLPLAA